MMLAHAVQEKNINSLEAIADRFDLQLAQAYSLLHDQQRRIARLEAPLRFIKKIFSPFFKK